MLALALCLAAALAAPPAPTEREAELMRMIQELKADMLKGKEELLAQRKASASVLEMQELKNDMSRVKLQLAAAQGNASAPSPTPAPVPAPKPADTDKVTAFFNAIKMWSAMWVGPFLLTDLMFWVSVLMVLQWHIRFHLAEAIHAKFFEGRFSKRQVKPMMTPRRLGLNILILTIYYDDSLPAPVECLVKGKPFVSAIVLVFMDTVVLFYSFMILGWSLSKHNHRGTEPAKSNEYIDPLDESEDDGHCPEKFEATNVYEDLTMQFRRVTPVWIVQMALVALYIEQLNKDKDTKDVNQVDYAYWVIAVIFQMHGGDGQVGEPFNALYWNRILNSNIVADLKTNVKWLIGKDNENASKQPFLDDDERSRGRLDNEQDLEELVKTAVNKATSTKARKHPDSTVNKYLAKLPAEIIDKVLEENTLQETMWRRSFNFVGGCWHKCFWVLDTKICLEWQIRRFMDFTVNSVARGIILYTVPIMVCVEGPLDFVKDLTAVMFITMLDDGGDNKTIEEMLVKMKFGLWCAKNEPSTLSVLKGGFQLNKVDPQNEASQDGGEAGEAGEADYAELNLVEKKYVKEHADKFERLDNLSHDDWETFCKQGEKLPTPPHVMEAVRAGMHNMALRVQEASAGMEYSPLGADSEVLNR